MTRHGGRPRLRPRPFSGFITRDWQGALALLAVLALVLVALALPFAGDRHSQLSAYDDDWDDISAFRRDLEELPYIPIDVRTISTSAVVLADIEDARNMTYIAVGVERPYTFGEWRGIRKFINSGGKVIIADDYGYGNSLLDFSGYWGDPGFTHGEGDPDVQYKFSRERLVDVRIDRNPLLMLLTVPIIPGLEYEVLLNDPSCFVENEYYHDYGWGPWSDGDARIIATSTENGWIDYNKDGIRDAGEPSGEHPVIIFEEGMLLISDPSIFTNDMYDRYENRELIVTIFSLMMEFGGTVLIDESIHIEPRVISELDDGTVRPLTVIFGDDWPFLTLILALCVGVAGIAVGSKRKLQRYEPHKDRLSEPRTLAFASPVTWYADYHDVRGVLLQRLRLEYGLDPDDVTRLTPEMLAQLLGDRQLATFAIKPTRLDSPAMVQALADVARWRAPVNSEAVLERAREQLAATQRGGGGVKGEGATTSERRPGPAGGARP